MEAVLGPTGHGRDGRGDPDLDVRLRQRPDPGRGPRLLRDGPRRPLLRAGRRRPTATTSRPSRWSRRGSGPSLLTLPVTVTVDPATGAVEYGNLYNQLLEYIIPVDLTFYTLMVGAVVVLAAKAPGRTALPDVRLPGPAVDLHRPGRACWCSTSSTSPRDLGDRLPDRPGGHPGLSGSLATGRTEPDPRPKPRGVGESPSSTTPWEPTAMIVSWNWLTHYVRLDMPVEALTERLALTGLNHESTAEVGGDLAIDLEVTSNRPDCLGHLGVAREISRPVRPAAPRPRPPAATVGRPGRDADRGGRSRRRPLPAVHRAGRLGRDGRREPLVAPQAARDPGRPADQQRRRRDELRHVRVRPAAARLRPRPPGRAPAGRPPRPAGRDADGDQRQGVRAGPRDARDRRRRAAGRPGRGDGGARHRDRPGDDRTS